MILYLDTSALVPLLVSEPSSEVCDRLWDAADDIVSSVAVRPEVASALWRARAAGRLTAHQQGGLLDAASELIEQIHLVVVDDRLSRRAADLATTHGLRGYDAVHAATALAVLTEDGLAATGDRQLVAAWQSAGLATCDVTASR